MCASPLPKILKHLFFYLALVQKGPHLFHRFSVKQGYSPLIEDNNKGHA